MKLYTFATSPYARKVRMALDIKGVAYEPLERCYSLDRKLGPPVLEGLLVHTGART